MHANDDFHPSGYFVYRAPAVFDTDSAVRVIEDLIESTKLSPYLAIDMSAVELMTSSAVTALLWAHRRTRVLGGRMVLAGMPQAASAALGVCGATDLFARAGTLRDIAPRPGWDMQSA